MNVVPGHDLGQLLHADLPIVVDVKKSKRLLIEQGWNIFQPFCAQNLEKGQVCAKVLL